MSFLRDGPFGLLKANKNLCLFCFLKKFCLKWFFYCIVNSFCLCMIPLWLTYTSFFSSSICNENENKTESFFVSLPVSMHQPAWKFSWATCCGKKYYMHFAISVVHYSRIFFSFPHYHRFRVTSRSSYVCLPRLGKREKKNYHQLHVITLLIETHNESDSLISTGNKLNKVLWNDWNLYVRIK